MIQAYIYGGLGNQLFQYATAKSLSILNKSNLYLCLDWFYQDFDSTTTTRREFDLGNFKISYGNTRDLIPRIYSKIYKPLFYKEKSPFDFDSDLTSLRKPNLWIDGYWSNFRYFDNIRDILIDEIQPVSINKANESLLEEIRQVNSVSLHVRRGDYVSNDLFITLDGSYYDKAIEYIKKRTENPVFFIFSDDIEYCKKEFQGCEFHIVDLNKGKDSYLDLFLMSQCSHNIIANSTFSWWGAYLNNNNDKNVIAPKLRYKEDHVLFEGINRKDPLNNNNPASWVLI